jgi:hypothetical protein
VHLSCHSWRPAPTRDQGFEPPGETPEGTRTRNGTRALTCYQQAVFILAWFRGRPGLSRLGQGFGISQATAYRYKDEGVEVLRALAPTLHDILEKAAEQGLARLMLGFAHVAEPPALPGALDSRGHSTQPETVPHRFLPAESGSSLPI